jgi:hypothetical protein
LEILTIADAKYVPPMSSQDEAKLFATRNEVSRQCALKRCRVALADFAPYALKPDSCPDKQKYQAKCEAEARNYENVEKLIASRERFYQG